MNYVPYHVHTMLSNGVTNIDSVTKYQDYIDAAKELGMKAFGFAEHGSIFEWYHKKTAVEAAGMKYIHAIECYVTEALEPKVRDNYHMVLIAKNYDGFLELNRLVSKSFNRSDGHFYYVPRVTIDEVFETSDNIIITTACLAGILHKGNEQLRNRLLAFIIKNKHRCFLEIQHHPVLDQVEYNKLLYSYSEQYGIKLIAGTDTHYLNDDHKMGREILQHAKSVRFEDEDKYDMGFKSYEQLIQSYQQQGGLSPEVYLDAIQNTCAMADMVECFELDTSTKYPSIYNNPEQTFRQKVYEALDSHPYALKNHGREELVQRIEEELEVYYKTGSTNFMLLEIYLKEWELAHNIQRGPGRGSVSGSMIAYLLGITSMDSMRFDLNFFRFMNPSRVTNADIDVDYAGEDRDKIKEFLLRDRMNLSSLHTAEIITFKTIKTKGAVREICRALYKDDPSKNYLEISGEISKMLDVDEEGIRRKYPEVFKYVDIVNGTVISIGPHPSGVLLSNLNIEETVGFCSTSTSPYPMSMLNMKELDELMYVKLDILGLDNIGIINQTCDLANIPRINPDNIDLEDPYVWADIVNDTTLIFQWESNSAQAFIKRIFSEQTLKAAKQHNPNFTMLKWMSFANGLLRPACASFRDEVANGKYYDNGFNELNDFLAPEAGRIAMQETIMRFLVKFCGYSAAESDNVRRAIAKKKGTETLLPEIESRFIQTCTEQYGLSAKRCEEIIKPFMQIILDASSYGYSWNHSDAYSAIGYMCGWLRHYYPLEFFTAASNIFSSKGQEKLAEISQCISRHKIKIKPPVFGLSKGGYFFDRDTNSIVKGVSSVKYLSDAAADTLYNLSKQQKLTSFAELLLAIPDDGCINKRQLEVLIKINYFKNFGTQAELLRLLELHKIILAGKISKDKISDSPFLPVIEQYSTDLTKSGKSGKSYIFTDVPGLFKRLEQELKNMNIQDLDDLVKIKNYVDLTGDNGYMTGNESDRQKLLVIDLQPLKKRATGEQFGYSVFTHSLGSGKRARFTLLNNVYNQQPFNKGQIIFCTEYKTQGAYFNLTKYKIL